jgi:hypothetical protein
VNKGSFFSASSTAFVVVCCLAGCRSDWVSWNLSVIFIENGLFNSFAHLSLGLFIFSVYFLELLQGAGGSHL